MGAKRETLIAAAIFLFVAAAGMIASRGFYDGQYACKDKSTVALTVEEIKKPSDTPTKADTHLSVVSFRRLMEQIFELRKVLSETDNVRLANAIHRWGLIYSCRGVNISDLHCRQAELELYSLLALTSHDTSKTVDINFIELRDKFLPPPGAKLRPSILSRYADIETNLRALSQETSKLPPAVKIIFYDELLERHHCVKRIRDYRSD
jgi:hypothetical protein